MRVRVLPCAPPNREWEKTSPLTVAHQGVTAGEPLGAADVRAEERIARPLSIFPHRLVRSRIEFDHA